jgi:hypothetical protein
VSADTGSRNHATPFKTEPRMHAVTLITPRRDHRTAKRSPGMKFFLGQGGQRTGSAVGGNRNPASCRLYRKEISLQNPARVSRPFPAPFLSLGRFDRPSRTCYKTLLAAWSAPARSLLRVSLPGAGACVVICVRQSKHPTRPNLASLFKSCGGSVFGSPAIRSYAQSRCGEEVLRSRCLNP